MLFVCKSIHLDLNLLVEKNNSFLAFNLINRLIAASGHLSAQKGLSAQKIIQKTKTYKLASEI